MGGQRRNLGDSGILGLRCRNVGIHGPLFRSFPRCVLGADTRRHGASWTGPGLPARQALEAGAGTLHLDQTCRPGSLPARLLAAPGDVVAQPAGVHPGHEAHLALPRAWPRPPLGSGSRAGGTGCKERSLEGSGFQGPAPVTGHCPADGLGQIPCPHGVPLPCAGSTW